MSSRIEPVQQERRFYAPDLRQLFCWLLVLPLALYVSIEPGAWPWLLFAAATILIICAWDWWRLQRLSLPEIQRKMEHNWPVGVWRPVELIIDSDVVTQWPRRCRQWLVHDWLPDYFSVRLPTVVSAAVDTHPHIQPDIQHSIAEHAPLEISISPNRADCYLYEARASRRGDAQFQAIDILMQSPWGWWRRRSRVSLPQQIKVYPNYAELNVYLQLAQQDRLDQMGIHHFARRGIGGDFHQLREYRAGDTLRQVDWKATSRMQRLISREYQEDRDQQVLLLLDCGRRMRHQGEARGHLDDSLDAMLLLAFAALRQGDAVGMMSFGGDERWFAPRKGANTINALLEAVYDLQAHAVASDYMVTAMRVMAQQKRRALVVLLTNTRDEDYDDLLRAARLLRRRHWVVIADMREVLLDQWGYQSPRGLDQALEFFASQDYLQARHQAHQQFGHHGIRMLDVLPQQLAPALVNEYLRMKRSGLLAV